MLVIDGNRILVAKVGFLVLLGPAGLGIFLRDAVDEQCVQPHRFIRTARCLDQLRLGPVPRQRVRPEPERRGLLHARICRARIRGAVEFGHAS